MAANISSNNVISHNVIALKAGGIIASAGNNLMVRNGKMGSVPTIIPLQ